MISIIIPVYNAEKYLGRCLESIQTQTYSNLEVILINDGSTDGSDLICKDFAEKDERFKYYIQANEGVAMARNLGLQLVRGEYIGFVDADDYVERRMFQSLIGPTSQCSYDVVLSKYKICSKHETTIPETKVPLETALGKNDIKRAILKSYYSGGDSIVPALWNKIYKREFIEEHNLSFQNQSAVRGSDYWFNFKVFQLANSCYALPDAHYCYNHFVTGSIINSFRPNQFEGYLESIRSLLEANRVLKFAIEEAKFYRPFYDNANRFIVLAIKNGGFLNTYGLVRNIMKNAYFIQSFKAVKSTKTHTKLIEFLLKRKYYFLSYLVYCLWSLK